MMRSALYFACGILFAAGLVISGMTDPGKVLGFLDITGRWDPSLALVMAGAVGSFGVLRLLVLKRERPLLEGEFPDDCEGSIDGRLLSGAGLFGLGWGLGGLCPGPAVTNLASLRPTVIVFVAAMVVGMLIAQRVFGADAG